MTEDQAKAALGEVASRHSDDYKIVGFGTKDIDLLRYARRYAVVLKPQQATQSFLNDLHLLAVNLDDARCAGSEPMLTRGEVIVEYFFIDIVYEVPRG